MVKTGGDIWLREKTIEPPGDILIAGTFFLIGFSGKEPTGEALHPANNNHHHKDEPTNFRLRILLIMVVVVRMRVVVVRVFKILRVGMIMTILCDPFIDFRIAVHQP